MRVAVLLLMGMVSACAAAPESGFKIVHVFPHDKTSFTEGLEFHDGVLYESTGLEERSVLRKVRLETGATLQEIRLPSKIFGEGITVIGGKLFQLTYKTEIGYIYDFATFRQLNTFKYTGEGWSLTNDGKNIYMDDGTSNIRVWDPATLKEIRRIHVHDGAKPIEEINELEWVRGEIYANVWKTERIARISPADGHVIGWIDLKGLLPASDREGIDVLNGIAYDAAGDRLFVTGKLWPKLFEIKIVPKAATKK